MLVRDGEDFQVKPMENHSIISNKNAEAALEYLNLGFSIVPVDSGTGDGAKRPYPIPNKCRYRWQEWGPLDTPSKITEFWTKYPDARVGILPPEGIQIIDIDRKNGIDGLKELEHFAPEDWSPFTSESGGAVVTGTGGFHLFFKASDATRGNGNRERWLPPGIDVRGDGKGYVLAAPSLHPTTGKPYVWIPGHELMHINTMPEMPNWIGEIRQKWMAAQEAPRPTPPPVERPPSSGDRVQNVLRAACERIRSAPEGTRNEVLNREAFALAGACADEGVDPSIIEDDLRASALQAGLSEHEVNATLASSLGAGAKAPLPAVERTTARMRKVARQSAQSDELPAINTGEALHVVVESAMDALSRINGMFQRYGHLVRCIRIGEQDASKRLPEGSIVIRPVALPTLRDDLSKVAYWERWDAREKAMKPTNPPSDVAAAVLERGEYFMVRTIVGIMEAPFMRPDGTVCDTPGHDRQTGFLYDPSDEFSAIPIVPSQEDAIAAYRQLEEIFCDFPTVSREHAAVPIAGILTLLARPMVGNVPAFIFEAATRGSGKTMMTDAIAIIATGRPVPKLSWPSGKDWRLELDKVLSSIAVDASSLICFDNISIGAKVGGAGLDKVLTCGGTTRHRTLGKTEAPELPWKTVIFLNGNNAVTAIQDETRRRVIPCRIVTDLERPEERTGFKHPNLLGWVKAERPRLVAAALTVLRHWVVAGRPEFVDPWGSFEEWSRVVPGSILAAGGPNIMETKKLIDENGNEDDAAFITLLEVLHDRFVQGATSKDIAKAAEGEFRVREAIEGVLGQGFTSRGLGNYLKGRRDRIFAGYRLTGCARHAHQTKWSVKCTDPEPTPDSTHEKIDFQSQFQMDLAISEEQGSW